MSLIIKNLFASLGDKKILQGIDLKINPGEIHAIMGPNGSGKSTLAGVLMGNPALEVRSEKLEVGKKDITDLKPDERAKLGLFLAFQTPISIPGVTVANLLKTAYQLVKQSSPSTSLRVNSRAIEQSKRTHNPALSVWKFNEILVRYAKKLGIPQEFLRRSLNEEFSGGEKKKLEMLQAIILQPKYAIFDEIDTGLDVDALKIVASAIPGLKKDGSGVLLITHYQRILRFVRPDLVHVLINGKIVASGNFRLAEEVEKNGYKKWQ